MYERSSNVYEKKTEFSLHLISLIVPHLETPPQRAWAVPLLKEKKLEMIIVVQRV